MKQLILRPAVLCLAALLTVSILPSCTPSSDPGHGTGTETQTDTRIPQETLPETQLTTDLVTEEETAMETETTAQPTPPPADGMMESPLHLAGFTQDKNAAYFTGSQCTLAFNQDGSVTFTGTWSEGKPCIPEFTISYSKLVKACCPSRPSDAPLPNEGEDKYPVVAMRVKAGTFSVGEVALSFTLGRSGDDAGCVLPIRGVTGDGEEELLVFDLTHTAFTSDAPRKLSVSWGFGTGDASNLGASFTLCALTLYHSLEEAWQTEGVQPQTAPDLSGQKLHVSADKLSPLVKDLFTGSSVLSETVMFLDPGDERELLFSIDEVLSVTSYDNRVTYRAGVDYEVRDGRLVALKGGSIPCITSERYYNAGPDSVLQTMHDGKKCYTHWGEGRVMTDWQVNVTYTHKDAWEGFLPPCMQGVFTDFISKLKKGEDVTLIFYGDSCTYGAASSYAYGYAPYQKSYAMLFTEALADLFGMRVHYVRTGKGDNCYVPDKDYVAGDRGTITFINPSVGGWTSADGVSCAKEYLYPFVERYGCDLFILDIGGNDGSGPAKNTRQNDKKITDGLLALVPDASILIMSTMIPNPESVNGWCSREFLQEPMLIRLTEAYRREGIPCAACPFTSVHMAVLDRVRFMDVTGNNLNHPNDFLARIYAMTLIRTVIGYENLDA